ncbi:hypothetical protein K439DRAFT_1612180 [Ramaria rubella]|nr:hypothetical protein K439DRAFT_1612180 [Ramaria rubella]
MNRLMKFSVPLDILVVQPAQDLSGRAPLLYRLGGLTRYLVLNFNTLSLYATLTNTGTLGVWPWSLATVNQPRSGPWPDLAFDSITTFINLLRHLKERIDFTKRSKFSTPPQCLPADIHQFLKQALDLDDITVQACWSSLKDLAWNQDHNIPTKPDLAALLLLFFMHGGPLHIAPIEVFPLMCKCLITTCSNYATSDGGGPDLAKPSTYKATIFMLVFGPLPMYTTLAYCRGKAQVSICTMKHSRWQSVSLTTTTTVIRPKAYARTMISRQT